MASSRDGEIHRIASTDDVPHDGGLIVNVEGEEVALFALEDGYYAISNVCTHQGGPLGKGKVEDGCVYCPWHGHQFDIRTGEHGHIDRFDTRTFDVEERDGELFVTL